MHHGDIADLSNAGNDNSGVIAENVHTRGLAVTTERNTNSNDFSRNSAFRYRNVISLNVNSRPGTPLTERETADLVNENNRLKLELSKEKMTRESLDKEIEELKYRLNVEEKRAKEVSEDVNRLLEELFHLINRVERVYSRTNKTGAEVAEEQRCPLTIVRDAVNRLHEAYQNAARKLVEAAHHREEAEFWRRQLFSGKRATTIAINEADAAKRLNDLLKQIFQLSFESSGRESEKEVIIAIMSQTTSGKSSFIRQLTGSQPNTSTGRVNIYHSRRDGHRVKFIDTPCFDNPDYDKGVTDIFVLREIANFLNTEDGKRLNGIIYLHPIKEKAIPRKLEIFKELCGSGAFKNVAIVTLQWDSMADHEETKCLAHEGQLKKFFEPFVDAGVRYIRHIGSPESARLIAAQFFHNSPIDLQIQKELTMGSELERTTAGFVLRMDITNLKRKHEDELQKLQNEMGYAIKENNTRWKMKLTENGKILTALLLRLTGELNLLKEKLIAEDLPKAMARDLADQNNEIISRARKMKEISSKMGQEENKR